MRHGEAEPNSPGGDAERNLSARGKDIVLAVAEGLKSIGVAPDEVIHSPFARAKQTSEIVADTLGVSTRVEEYALIPGGDAKMAAKILFAARSKTTFVVAHLPILPKILSIYLGGAMVDFSTADVAKLVVVGADGPQGAGIIRGVYSHEVLSRVR